MGKDELRKGGTMSSQRNILIAFILNLSFSILEFVGGAWSGSVAIMSDAVHDLGDAVSIGVAYGLERRSRKAPDKYYSFGYLRASVLGSVITNSILLAGSVFVVYHAVHRLLNPKPIHYDGMLIFAVIGLVVNAIAAYVTREGDSMNQKAVNLHMMEDVLGWLVVLVGAIVIRFTNWLFIDSLLSIGVAIFILVHAGRNMKEILDLFMVRVPSGIDLDALRSQLLTMQGVEDIHHMHVWSLDGQRHYATMHVVCRSNDPTLKQALRDELKAHGIVHTTLEFEHPDDACVDPQCSVPVLDTSHHHHHHH